MAKTKYKNQYAADLIEYFMSFLRGKNEENQVYPSLVRFADKIGVTPRTLANWRDEHEAFKEAYEFADAIQDEVLNEKALTSKFDGKVAMKIRELKINSKKAALDDSGGGVKLTINIGEDESEEKIAIQKWTEPIHEDTDY